MAVLCIGFTLERKASCVGGILAYRCVRLPRDYTWPDALLHTLGLHHRVSRDLIIDKRRFFCYDKDLFGPG